MSSHPQSNEFSLFTFLLTVEILRRTNYGSFQFTEDNVSQYLMAFIIEAHYLSLYMYWISVRAGINVCPVYCVIIIPESYKYYSLGSVPAKYVNKKK